MNYMLKVICIALIGLILSAVQGQARTIYVPAGSSIQDSLNVASPGDTVLVGPGIFYENITWPAIDSIVLISEFGPDSTTIDGFAGRVIYFDNPTVTNATKVEGFTITNGYSSYGGAGIRMRNGAEATIVSNVIRGNECVYYGAGIYVRDSNPVIRENIIENNHVTSTSQDTTHYGGGIYCHNSGALIENNTIRGNRIEDYGKGAGIALRESHTIVRNNRIEEDTAVSLTGGGIYMYSSADTITENVITDNFGTGILARNSDSCLIEKNKIEFNRGGLGGGIHLNNSSCRVYENMIQENSAEKGGGIYCYSSDAEIVGNSITSNIADDDSGGTGGGILVNSGSPLLEENIISRNSAEEGTTGDGSGGGIFVTVATDVIIKRNTIVLNYAAGDSAEGGGIRLLSSTSEVGTIPAQKNNIYHNFSEFGSNLMAGILSTCDATHNYWGTSDSSRIAITINIDNGDWYPLEDLPLSVVKTVSDTGFYTFGEMEIYFSSLILGSDSTVEVTIYGDSVPPYCTGINHIAKFFDLQGNFTFDAYFGFYYTDEEFIISGVPWEDSIHAYRYNGISWDIVPGVVDSAENLVIVNSSEFSVWMLGEDLVGVEERENVEIMNYELNVYPNPFKEMTEIRFQSAYCGGRKSEIPLCIYDLSGRLIGRINKGMWNGKDADGKEVQSGIYFLKAKGYKPMKIIKLK